MEKDVEEDFVESMKDVILTSSEEVAQKVIESASQFIKKKGWIKEGSEEDCQKFLNEKLPKVICKETSKKLNTILGLDL